MSGTRIRVQVHSGQVVAAAMRLERDRHIARRTIRAQQLVAERVGSMCEPIEARALEIQARQEVLSAPMAREVDPIVDWALRTKEPRALAEAEVLLERVELTEERQVERRALFATLIDRLPAGLAAAPIHCGADGSFSARVELADGGSFMLGLGTDGHGDLDFSDGLVAEIEGPTGTAVGCDAEAVLRDRVTQAWAAAGVEVSLDDLSDVAIDGDHTKTGQARS